MMFINILKIKSGINFPLLILDEITAPLDIENTNLFYNILSDYFKDLTIFTINHRIEESDNKNIDNIIEVEKRNGFSKYNVLTNS